MSPPTLPPSGMSPLFWSELLKSLKNQRLFISGATGFFGKSTLAFLRKLSELESLNLELSLLTRDSARFKSDYPELSASPLIQFVDGDLLSFEFPQKKFDAILHFAAPLNVESLNSQKNLEALNAGNERMLEFCIHNKTSKFLLASSGAIYGPLPADISHVDEDYQGTLDLNSKYYTYAEAKRHAENLGRQLAVKYGFSHYSARCFTFVGPYLDANGPYAIGNFIRDAVQDKEIKLSGDGTPLRSYLYSQDLVIWLLRILSHGKSGEVYNVGSDESLSILELAQKVARVLKTNIPVKTQKQITTQALAQIYVPSLKKARRELGVDTWTSLEDAISLTAAHYRKLLYK